VLFRVAALASIALVLGWLLGRRLKKGRRIMALIDDIESDVTVQTTVIDGVMTLLTNLKAQIDAAGTDPAKLQAIKDGLLANTKKLADAVAANTVAQPPTP